MQLRDLQRNWDELGERDALWAILTHPDKTGGRWDTDEFFRSGWEHVASLARELEALGASSTRGRVLDFGCGVGRLTQAFADRFDEADGVDIAPSMVERARVLNRHGERCRYHVNSAPDLRLFDDDTFDLVFSVIVLQHMAPELAVGYIGEFFRVAKHGGVVVFQVPSRIKREPLPRSAQRAEVSAQIPATGLPAARQVELEVRVRNAGSAVWPAGEAVALRVGNHWLDERGGMLRLDDARRELPHDVAPGATVTLPLDVTTPNRPGTYLLEIDLVQEGITWFADAGSTPARYRVDVTTDGAAAPVAPHSRAEGPASPAFDDDEPVMEMHGVARETVLDVIASSHGEVLRIDSHDDAPPWESFTYFARKR